MSSPMYLFARCTTNTDGFNAADNSPGSPQDAQRTILNPLSDLRPGLSFVKSMRPPRFFAASSFASSFLLFSAFFSSTDRTTFGFFFAFDFFFFLGIKSSDVRFAQTVAFKSLPDQSSFMAALCAFNQMPSNICSNRSSVNFPAGYLQAPPLTRGEYPRYLLSIFRRIYGSLRSLVRFSTSTPH